MRAPDESMTADQRLTLDEIREQGVHIATHLGAPAAAHTAGLWPTYGHPEVVVIGLEPDVAGELLELLTDEIDAGRRFAAGERHEGLVHGYRVHFGAVTAEQAATWLAVACWVMAGTAVPCLQLVYPDKQGRWPWDPACREGFAVVQPVLERQAATAP